MFTNRQRRTCDLGFVCVVIRDVNVRTRHHRRRRRGSTSSLSCVYKGVWSLMWRWELYGNMLEVETADQTCEWNLLHQNLFCIKVHQLVFQDRKKAASEHQHWRVFPIDLFWCDSSASVSGNTTQRWETLNWILLKSQIWCDVHCGWWWAATTRPSLHSSCVMMRHRVF